MRIESLDFDMEMEQSAQDNLDEILERRLEEERRSTVQEVEGVRMDLSMEDFEIDRLQGMVIFGIE